MKFNPGGGSMNKMIKQAKQVQEQIVKMQEELREREIEASSGGGVVTVKINGKQELIAIQIKPEAVDMEDLEMLEDLVLAAVNEGIRKSQEMVSSEMSKITGGFNIPGL
ncbi:MAG: YbaB/EbfC family nucleoid-associated protein [Syntrophomonas sp.]|uniref:YbaB/EbfC family nucleoid-associated protein n=1 Tax=Syntrophomonas sp. TaxID=2053627 RepID=UPI00262AD587|nr:YbaB/EbfC family nucleoid-associated protein [Syntrophomonas sp.]MDD2511202.1 YbaB/EbfC family nucleoid-associated protein [Syntrophomonas sp.]MDD3878648.1 YbaB/EbfC family nucleoid-associated protein [Syntrophomonas sp.]MDD4627144.1 YbaB/EbfC family nucleoid-associated protein [Syntrophomonas sp.]